VINIEYSVIVPVYNEEKAIESTLDRLYQVLKTKENGELIIVNDGSVDGSVGVINTWQKSNTEVVLVEHTKNKGYGASLKTGIKTSNSKQIVIVDADGTYPIEEIPIILEALEDHDMIIGSRNGENVSYPFVKKIPKAFLKCWIMYLTMSKVPDFNSGLRAFQKGLAIEAWDLFPNGFSFTTTITMYALCKNKKVKFIPISYFKRIGSSKIHPIKDTIRFFRIVSRLGYRLVPVLFFTPLIIFSIFLIFIFIYS